MTLPSILADLNNAVVWMASNCLLISKSSSPCTNSLVTVPSPPITIGITVTFIFYSFFSFLARFLFLLSFSFTQYSAGTVKSTLRQVLLSGQDWVIRLYLKIPEKSHSFGQILGCAYIICSYGQIQNSCTIPRGSASPPIRIWFYILFFLLTYCICFLCDWSFRLYHHIIYICYFVASCLLLLWHS